ncbi:hypothetical protein [Novosphingobium panipatense]
MWKDMEEMVRLGAYRPGANAEVDRAVALAPRIEDLLRQDQRDRSFVAADFAALRSILEGTS